MYEYWGVQEYFLFDPLNEYLKPRLQGFHLVNGTYQPINLAPDGTLYSQELGLLLDVEDRRLRLIDPNTNEAIPSIEEAAERAQTEAKRAQTAESRAAQLERENAELRRQLGKEV
jgi:hypothetical protein